MRYTIAAAWIIVFFTGTFYVLKHTSNPKQEAKERFATGVTAYMWENPVDREGQGLLPTHNLCEVVSEPRTIAGSEQKFVKVQRVKDKHGFTALTTSNVKIGEKVWMTIVETENEDGYKNRVMVVDKL